jgi:hypothetical protein
MRKEKQEKVRKRGGGKGRARRSKKGKGRLSHARALGTTLHYCAFSLNSFFLTEDETRQTNAKIKHIRQNVEGEMRRTQCAEVGIGLRVVFLDGLIGARRGML